MNTQTTLLDEPMSTALLETNSGQSAALVEHDATPESVIANLIRSDADPAKVKEWSDLLREWRRDRAAEAFAEAKAEFQSRCPVIQKKRKAGDGAGFGYKFCSYEDVMEIARPILHAVGISTGFDSEVTDKGIKTICRLRKGSHVEESSLTLPVPSNMKVNDTQKMGAAFQYGKRYAVCGALDIVVGDEDNDAAKLIDTIGDDDIATLNDWLSNTDTKLDRFLKWAGVDSLAHFPASKMDEAIAFFKAKGHR